jgi:hypothetical protein
MDDDLARILPQPQRKLLTSLREYLEACDELFAGAHRELRIFDPDGAQLQLNTPARIDTLRRFLLASRDSRLLIAVHDPDHLRLRAPRFLTLLSEFSASTAVHQTEGEALHAQDCFVLADAQHFVRRPVAGAARGVYVRNDMKETRPIRDRFDEIWQCSFQAISATTLGL